MEDSLLDCRINDSMAAVLVHPDRTSPARGDGAAPEAADLGV
jgi:hypothetical protein